MNKIFLFYSHSRKGLPAQLYIGQSLSWSQMEKKLREMSRWTIVERSDKLTKQSKVVSCRTNNSSRLETKYKLALNLLRIKPKKNTGRKYIGLNGKPENYLFSLLYGIFIFPKLLMLSPLFP